MRIPNIARLFEDRNLAAFTLVFMSVQFVFWEGMTVSIPKVAFMAVMPIVLLVKLPNPTKALVWGFVYLLMTIVICQFNGGITRMSTFIYSALFLFTFSVYYGLVWVRDCFTLQYFLNLVKCVISGYTVCLLLQQLFILAGIRYFPLINLVGGTYYAFNHLNTLAIEPSHAARLMTVYFYAFLKCTEYMNGAPMTIKELYSGYKWIVGSFLYFMVFIGSGTAFVGLAILSLYFLKRQYVIPVILVSFLGYMMSPYIDYEPYNRAVDTLNAAMTGDTEEVIRTDHSASSRVNIIIDTFTKTDLTDPDTWIGHGMGSYGQYAINSAIYEYGMISYLLKIVFFVSCCFTSIVSLETLMFIILFGMNVGNVAYGWAALMVFATLKYFKETEY